MKTELKAKFLQHMVQKKQDKGFTLIELLVVIIIIGILSAIALPSFLNQAAKAKQTEAKNYVGSVNRAQQAYRIEKPAFAKTFADLEIGIPDKTQDYTYTIDAANNDVKAAFTAEAADKSLKDYTGGVVVLTDSGQTSVASCQTKVAGGTAVAVTLDQTNGAKCDGASEPMR